MVSYKIEIKPSAEKELEKLPRQMIPRVFVYDIAKMPISEE